MKLTIVAAALIAAGFALFTSSVGLAQPAPVTAPATRVEEAREMLGLVIVVVWMAVLAAWGAPSGHPAQGRHRRVG